MSGKPPGVERHPADRQAEIEHRHKGPVPAN
jgi:hypothetical protein